MKLSWKFTGPEQTQRRLGNVKRSLRTKALRKAGNEASKLGLQAMKQTAPVAKPDYGPGGSARKSLGRKVKVYRGVRVVWLVGPRSKWSRIITRRHKYWRDAEGRVRKMPNTRARKVAPSRIAHVIERQSRFIGRAERSSRYRQQQAALRALQELMQEA